MEPAGGLESEGVLLAFSTSWLRTLMDQMDPGSREIIDKIRLSEPIG